MTSVYSGGLVYEYSEEGSNFGLVKIDGNSVTDKDDYDALKSALQKTPAPSGDGGFKTDGTASKCPSKSTHWDVDIADDELPAFPSKAETYLKNGAGDGPGLKGGSQDAGPAETSLAPAASGAVASGAVASGGASSTKGAAVGLHPPAFQVAPIICGVVVMASALLGGSLVL